MLALAVPLQVYRWLAVIPVEVVAIALPVSQQRLDRDGHRLRWCTWTQHTARLAAWFHSPELRLMMRRFSVPLGITPALVFMDYSALRSSALFFVEVWQRAVTVSKARWVAATDKLTPPSRLGREDAAVLQARWMVEATQFSSLLRLGRGNVTVLRGKWVTAAPGATRAQMERLRRSDTEGVTQTV